MRKAKSPVEQTDTAAPMSGSIADVAARLALWGRRAPKGLARVEFVSDFSRQEVVSQLRTTLPQHIPVHEIELPFQQPAIEAVRFLRERLRELRLGVVSVTGFATAFSENTPPTDALRVLNFHRENLAQFPMCQIWWMTHPFAENFLRSVPDLDSWFMLRLKLSEIPERKSTSGKRIRYVPKDTLEQDLKQSNYLAERATNSLQRGMITVWEYLEWANEAVQVLSVIGADEEAASLAGELGSTKVPTFESEDKLELEDENSLERLPNYRGILVKLAHLYEAQQKYSKAEELYRKAIQTEMWNALDPDDVLVLPFLAWSCANQNKYKDADFFYQKAYGMAVANFNLDEDAFQYESFLCNLYIFYRYTNQLEKAELYATLALSVAEKYLGLSSTNVAARANDLATIYTELGRFMEAELLLNKALQIHTISSAPTDLRVTTLLSNLGLLYVKQDKPREAEPLFSRALKIREETFGSNHIKVAEILKHYSELLYSLNRGDEAKAMANRMSAIEAGQMNENSTDA